MITSKVTWNGEGATNAIMKAAWLGIVKATVMFWNELQKILNVHYPPASRPGEPPRKRTGWLARHVIWEGDQYNLTTRVGLMVNAIYGLYLELGTKRIAARPWFEATLKRMLPSLKNVFTEVKVGDG